MPKKSTRKISEKFTKEELAVLTAEPLNEPDRAKIKWPKPRKWTRPPTRTTLRPKARPHPGTERAREILKSLGRSLTVCESCGLEGKKMMIHHVDQNPYNNDPSNLKVLCRNCHGKEHFVVDSFGVKEWYYGTKPDL